MLQPAAFRFCSKCKTMQPGLFCGIVSGLFPCGRLSWLPVSFLLHVKYPLSYRILQAPRRSHAQPLLRELHWLPIQHRIEYKVAVLTFKSRSSATAPTYFSHHIKARISERTLRSSTAPLLDKAVHQNGLCESSLSLFCTDRLELVA